MVCVGFNEEMKIYKPTDNDFKLLKWHKRNFFMEFNILNKKDNSLL